MGHYYPLLPTTIHHYILPTTMPTTSYLLQCPLHPTYYNTTTSYLLQHHYSGHRLRQEREGEYSTHTHFIQHPTTSYLLQHHYILPTTTPLQRTQAETGERGGILHTHTFHTTSHYILPTTTPLHPTYYNTTTADTG